MEPHARVAPKALKLLMKYKRAKTATERQAEQCDRDELYTKRPYLLLTEWSVEDVKADKEQCGLSVHHQGEEDRAWCSRPKRVSGLPMTITRSTG